MAIRRILKSDNTDDRTILKRRSSPVKFPFSKLKQLIDDLLETLYATPTGVGLSAPQIGVLLRVAVVGIRPAYKELEGGTKELMQPGCEYILVNPHIVKRSDVIELGYEGCLSIPNIGGEVPRATWVTVDYFDISGKKHRLKSADNYYMARVIQHEIDHLDGILFPERITDLSKLYRTESKSNSKSPDLLI